MANNIDVDRSVPHQHGEDSYRTTQSGWSKSDNGYYYDGDGDVFQYQVNDGGKGSYRYVGKIRQTYGAQGRESGGSEENPAVSSKMNDFVNLLLSGQLLNGYKKDTAAATNATAKSAQQLAAEEFASQQEYLPKEYALAQQLAAEYLPQQYQLSAELQRIYGPEFQDIANILMNQQRVSELSTAKDLAPQIQEIMAASRTPENQAIYETLSRQIMSELAAGGKITPEQERVLNEEIRSGQIARGLGSGQGDVNREAVSKALASMDLASSRQSKASQWLAQDSASTPDPFTAILNRTNQFPTTMAYTSLNSSLATPTTASKSPSDTAISYGLQQTALGNQSNANNLSALTNLYGTNVSGTTAANNLASQNAQYMNALMVAQAMMGSQGINYSNIPFISL